jgi:TldD protein
MDKNIIPILHNIKKYLKSKKLDYFEIRFEKHNSRLLIIENKNTKDLSEKNSQGIGIRILINKKIGFLSLNNLSNYKLKIDKLIENTLKVNTKTEMDNFSKIKDKDFVKYKNFEKVENKNKIKELLELNKPYLKKEIKNNKILSSEIIQKEIIMEKYFLTKDAEIHQKRPYNIFYSLMTGKLNNQIETSFSKIGNLGGLEILNKENKANTLLKNKNTLIELLESKPCPAISSDIILDPSVTGLLAHEAIGHACEGDIIIDNLSILKKDLKISDNLKVSVTDNPELKNFGYLKYDDEGIKAKKTSLIKKGIVNNFMTNLNSATKLKIKPNGSARSENYYNSPIVRMSNTYFETGKYKIEDMLKNFTGYLLKEPAGGQVSPNVGTFMFGIKQAYKYKNGKIIDKYKQASIAGNILTYLNQITEISKKQGDIEFGFCGKGGQTAFVGDAGPHIKIKNAKIGGTKHE